MYHLSEEKDEMFMLGWVADYPTPIISWIICFTPEARITSLIITILSWMPYLTRLASSRMARLG